VKHLISTCIKGKDDDIVDTNHKRLMDQMYLACLIYHCYLVILCLVRRYNATSSLTAAHHLQADMGVKVKSERYVAGMTFEKEATDQSSLKYRLLLVREELLKEVQNRKAEDVADHPYMQYRWKTHLTPI